MVDTLDSKSGELNAHAGSSPARGTIFMNEDFQAIVKYIDEHLRRGASVQQLRSHLIKHGWNEAHADHAFRLHSLENQKKRPGPKRNFIRKIRDNKKKIIIYGGMAAGITVGLYVAGIISFDKFKTVTYDNGVGSKYEMTFYSKSNQYKQAWLGGEKELNSTELVSRYTKDDKLPITLSIKASPPEDKAGNTSMVDESCSDEKNPKVMTAYNPHIQKDINVCALRLGVDNPSEENDVMYAAVFTYNSKRHNVMISQDIFKQVDNYSPNISDDKLGKEIDKLETKTGLKAYQDDLRTILSSIRPLER